MTLDEVASAIRKAVNDRVVTALGFTVQFPNQDLRILDDSAYVKATILFGGNFQASVGAPGSNIFRRTGVLAFLVSSPVSKGDGDALTMATAIEAAFRATTVNDVVFQTPSTEVLGAIGKWYQLSVQCPFYADHLG